MKMRLPLSGLTDHGEVSARSLKIETLATLRWLATLGQTAATVFVYLGLHYPMPLAPCVTLILLSVSLNIVLRVATPPNYRLGGPYATALLAYDVCQLAAFLYFTGGLDNPFSFLLLAPVLISAATLPSRTTVLLGTLVAFLAALLAVLHFPLPWSDDLKPVLPPLYLVSIWIAFLLTVAFSAIYAFRVSEEARQLAEALAAAELVLLREQHLTALDGLAAAAAHELGTPLGTIAVVARELERELVPGSPIAEDIALLKSQSNRCRDILRKLTELGSEHDLYFVRMPLSQLIEEVAEPFRATGHDISVTERGFGAAPVGTRNPAISHGLGNIIENAADFAAAKVSIVATWDDATVAVTVSDDGPGFHSTVIDRLGEPFVTSRGDRPDSRASHDFAGGLGLGYFIAKTLLKRSGATVVCANKKPPETGAVVVVTWPRNTMDRAAAAAHLSELPGARSTL